MSLNFFIVRTQPSKLSSTRHPTSSFLDFNSVSRLFDW